MGDMFQGISEISTMFQGCSGGHSDRSALDRFRRLLGHLKEFPERSGDIQGLLQAVAECFNGVP